MTHGQRALIGRIGGLNSVAAQGADLVAARARAGLLSKFEQQARAARPGASDDEIKDSAELLRRAHFARLALASSQARAKRASRQSKSPGTRSDMPSVGPGEAA